jgi:Fatty acid cis/trans isomerase (CTI)
LKPGELSHFAETVSQLNSEKDYEQLLDRYGIRRTNTSFWSFSDWLHRRYKKISPLEAGLMDYNRFENR